MGKREVMTLGGFIDRLEAIEPGTERLDEIDVLRTHLRDLDANLLLLLRRLREAESERDLAKQWGAELLVERDMLASSLEGRNEAAKAISVETCARRVVVLEDDGDPA